jgi:hypothetical protein
VLAARTALVAGAAILFGSLSGCGLLLGGAFDLKNAEDGGDDVGPGPKGTAADADVGSSRDGNVSSADGVSGLEAGSSSGAVDGHGGADGPSHMVDANTLEAGDGAARSDAPIDSNLEDSASDGGTLSDAASDSGTANVDGASDAGADVLDEAGPCPGAVPPNFGESCGSCGGTVQCDGGCSVATPSDLGAGCGNCGGTVLCSGMCSKADTTCAPTGSWYNLTNALLAGSLVLDTWGGGPPNEAFMNTNCCSGSAWEITPVAAGIYRLTNRFLGETRSLEAYPDGHKLFMGDTGDNAAQYWVITALGGGNFRLTNSALGSGYSLDTKTDGTNDPFMNATSASSGQYWTITLIN